MIIEIKEKDHALLPIGTFLFLVELTCASYIDESWIQGWCYLPVHTHVGTNCARSPEWTFTGIEISDDEDDAEFAQATAKMSHRDKIKETTKHEIEKKRARQKRDEEKKFTWVKMRLPITESSQPVCTPSLRQFAVIPVVGTFRFFGF